MSFLFGDNDKPQPAQVPVSPTDSEAAARERRAAEDRALSEARESGRRQTVVGGMTLAQEDQQDMLRRRRGTGRSIVG